MLTVGLTGGIASGKSTVARLLQQRGCAIIEADLLAREYLQPENPVSQEVLGEFGAGILDTNGKIDRAKLGEIVFGHAGKIARLNAIIHPRAQGNHAPAAGVGANPRNGHRGRRCGATYRDRFLQDFRSTGGGMVPARTTTRTPAQPW